MESIIEVKNLTVRYNLTDAVLGVSFSIHPGDFIGLAGPNGAGKTTLVKALLSLLPITAGKIFLFGQSQKSFTDWQKIGYLPQKFSINPLFPASAFEVVSLGLLSAKKMPKIISKDDKLKVETIFHELAIANLKNKLLTELSSGQAQRVLLARSLVGEPKILIFDEPSTALDPETREVFFSLIQRLNQEKKITIILITHDTGDLGRYATKLLYLDKRLVFFGNFADFCHSEKMKGYFGSAGQHIVCHQHN